MCTHIINALYCVLGCCCFTKDVTLILFLCMQHLVTNVFKTVTVTKRLAVWENHRVTSVCALQVTLATGKVVLVRNFDIG